MDASSVRKSCEPGRAGRAACDASDHVVGYLAGRRKAFSEPRVALLIIDGLAIDQWLVIREVLTRTSTSLRMEEWAVFAWVPTLTSVSRQTIFSGEIPLLFADSLTSTSKEET